MSGKSPSVSDLSFSYNTSVLKIINVNYCFTGVLVVTMIMVRPNEKGFFSTFTLYLLSEHVWILLAPHQFVVPFPFVSIHDSNAMKFRLHCIGIARCHNVFYEPKNIQHSVLLTGLEMSF